MAEAGTHPEREFEIGSDEAWRFNVKRLCEEFLQESLTDIRQRRSYVEKVLSDAQQHDNTRETIADQALQNAVETANMVSKQAVRHSDIAIDRQWNVDEVAQLVAKSAIFMDAIAAAVAARISRDVGTGPGT